MFCDFRFIYWIFFIILRFQCISFCTAFCSLIKNLLPLKKKKKEESYFYIRLNITKTLNQSYSCRPCAEKKFKLSIILQQITAQSFIIFLSSKQNFNLLEYYKILLNLHFMYMNILFTRNKQNLWRKDASLNICVFLRNPDSCMFFSLYPSWK